MPSESTIYKVCSYLRNFFNRGEIYVGDVTISNGALAQTYGLLPRQYFCISNSHKNDGVHEYPTTVLSDERFDGTIIGMSIPKAVLEIMDKIEMWERKYSDIDSVNMSPYRSESFGGYSYSKSSGGSGDTSRDKSGTWQGVFAAELAPWRKI